MFSIAWVVTPADLDRLFLAIECVLAESDPALDLPESDRWAAGLYGKKRDHSSALRKGVSETLAILAVYGNSLFQSRLGIDIEGRVERVVIQLLTPLTIEALLTHDRDLPLYAEAAPDAFLDILEQDLRRAAPVVFGLLKPVDSGSLWGSPARTGLLWALECLAWKPQNLPRVAQVLAELSLSKIDDNWTNKPDASLQAILRSWMPQTAASVDQRIKTLAKLATSFPPVAWEIALEQVKPGSRIGHYSNRPRWRSDASGAGQVVGPKERNAFTRAALDLLIEWPTHTDSTLGDLVEALQGMPEGDQVKVWNLIDKWSATADEEGMATLRERIRRFAFTRHGLRLRLGEATRDRAREAYDGLTPADPVVRNGWLFVDQWVAESVNELYEEDIDFRQREERIDKLRHEAIVEIWAQRGIQSVQDLLSRSNAASMVGHYAAACTEDFAACVAFVRGCLSLNDGLQVKADGCLQGYLLVLKEELRTAVLRATAMELSSTEQSRLFSCAPFQWSTWRLLSEYEEVVRAGYWNNVIPYWNRHTPAELTELIDRLLEVQRPRAAFHAVHMDFDNIETTRLTRLLRDIATVGGEPAGYFKLDRHYISAGLESLDGRVGVTRNEMAELEFLFITMLADSTHGIPNLESQVAESPLMYVQAVTLAYKRSDDGIDPPGWRIEDPDQKMAVATAAHRLLDELRIIPGKDGSGRLDAAALGAWLAEVRALCQEHGRQRIGDHCLGQLLAKAPGGEDGRWPDIAVCQAMEEIASQEIAKGFRIGVHNSRGVVWRAEGGQQERDLAARYREWAERLHFEFPYVGSILESIAVSYEREAGWQDSEERIAKRLRH